MKQHVKSGLLVSTAIYGCTVFTTLSPEIRRFFDESFPGEIASMQPSTFFGVLTAVLCLPVFALGIHAMNVIMNSAKRVRGTGSALLALLVPVEEGSPIRKSQYVAWGVSAYFIGLMVVWIAFAESRGI